jgi:hypothetical protein
MLVATVTVTATETSAAARSPTAGAAASPPLSRAGATALAKAINLTRADLPGSTAAPDPVTASELRSDAQLAACEGAVPPSRYLAKVNSPTLSLGAGLTVREVSSSVTVLPSAALVRQDLRAINSGRGHSCIKQAFAALLRHSVSGVRFSGGRISALPVSASGTDGAFGLRISLAGSEQGKSLPLYLDVLSAARGPAQLSLEAVSIAAPVSLTVERRLLGVLVRRADARITG